MDPDPNKYDVCQRVTHHAHMTDAEWDQAFRDAWFTFYTPEHMERVCRRSAAQERKGVNFNEVVEVFEKDKDGTIEKL